jgi:hypothetical protein
MTGRSCVRFYSEGLYDERRPFQITSQVNVHYSKFVSAIYLNYNLRYLLKVQNDQVN